MSTPEDSTHSPTMLPQQGVFSSKGAIDFGVQVGQYVVHRGPTEWVLDRMPDSVAGTLRKLVAKGFREIGKRTMLPETELQQAMNGKLFMNTTDAETGRPLMAEVEEGYTDTLFPYGKQKDWPSQVVFCTKDVRPDPAMLRQAMLDFPAIAGEVLEQEMDVVGGFDEKTAGRMVVLGVYNTDQDVLHNAGAVLERTQELRHDPHSTDGMSDAAVKAGETLLQMLTLRHEFGETILRDDAPEIMRHVMSHGYSQGGNIATDIFRYVRSELMSGRYELAQDAKGGRTVNTSDPQVVTTLMQNAYCYTIAAADIPYQPDDLHSLPPRDNSRSDGDLVISAAVGTNRKQSNYNSQWRQDAPDSGRNDRLLESIGPRKKLFGLGEPRGKGYHSMLGHGDDSYRHSVVKDGGELLKERFAPRLLGKPLLADMTFAEVAITLDFERGTPSKTMAKAQKQLVQTLADAELPVALPDSPYQLRVHAAGDAKTLKTIGTALESCGIERSQDMHIALNAQLVGEWMERRLQKLPNAHVDVVAGEHGPALRVHPAGVMDSVGPQVAKMLRNGLERAGINSKQQQQDGYTVEVSLQDAMAAFKDYRKRGHAEEQSR